MKKIMAAITLAAVMSAPANACPPSVWKSVFGIDTGLSCEQRRALRAFGAAQEQVPLPGPSPFATPSPLMPLPPIQMPQAPSVIMPMGGGAWVVTH